MNELKLFYSIFLLNLDPEEIKTVMNIPYKYFSYNGESLMSKIRIRHMQGLPFDTFNPTTEDEKFFDEILKVKGFKERISEYIQGMKIEYINKKLVEAAREEDFSKKSELLTKIQQELRNEQDSIEMFDISNIPTRYAKSIEDMDDNLLKTGWTKFDNNIQPEPGNYVVICGRTSMGKTAFALNYFLNLVKKGNKGVYFSLEMSDRQICSRIMSSESAVSLSKIKKKENFMNMKDQDEKQYGVASSKISNIKNRGKIAIGSMSIDQIEEKAKLAKEIDNIDFIFVDYLQIVTSEYKNRTEAVTNISIRLTNLAKNLGIVVFVLAQLSREAERDRDTRPQLHHLKDSGQTEQDARIVIGLYRESYYDPEKNDTSTEVIFMKNSEGSTGKLSFTFLPTIQKFNEKYGEEGKREEI